jgi:LmbE family N-acetylglucosaminyl deacetylase
LLALSLSTLRDQGTVLCLGAHCDDIEIGCGGTLLRIAREYPLARFRWIVFSGSPSRETESRDAAQRLLGTERVSIEFLRFRQSHFPFQYDTVKAGMEATRAAGEPDLVFTHFLEDRHQDHRILAELTWNTFRRHLILEYEIPKYEGDLGHPNAFFPVAEADLDSKVQALMASFHSQLTRTWFTPETFRALARIRGIECASPTGYAEAFHARKLCF